MRAGFTLIELLVVLVILAALTLVAVRVTDTSIEQGRYEATQRGLKEIEDAIVGPANQLDSSGTLRVTGFVADVGRLPVTVGTDPTTQAAELWTNPNGIAPYGRIDYSAIDSEVSAMGVYGGWRGPYLRLGAGLSTLTDGWGNAYDFIAADRSNSLPFAMPGAGMPIAIIRSRGSDGVAAAAITDDYSNDLYTVFADSVGDASRGIPIQDRTSAQISVKVQLYDVATGTFTDPKKSDGDVTVRIFGPSPSGFVSRVMTVLTTSDVTMSTTFPVAVTFGAESIGPRVIRAYQGATGLSGATKKSVPVRVVLTSGGGPAPTLTLQ